MDTRLPSSSYRPYVLIAVIFSQILVGGPPKSTQLKLWLSPIDTSQLSRKVEGQKVA